VTAAETAFNSQERRIAEVITTIENSLSSLALDHCGNWNVSLVYFPPNIMEDGLFENVHLKKKKKPLANTDPANSAPVLLFPVARQQFLPRCSSTEKENALNSKLMCG
jgi:hypothetical protein